MTKPKNAPPPAPMRPLTLEDRAREFLSILADVGVPHDALVKLLTKFADELLVEVERAITDQHRHPAKLSRLYWQARMDAGREIHELRRGRGGA